MRCGRIGVLTVALRAEPTPIREPLSVLPLRSGAGTGRVEPDFTDEIAQQLGVDEVHIVRSYASNEGLVGLYVGFYASQRQGDSIHSPLNCLPGAGWVPIEQARTVVPVPTTPSGPMRMIEIDRFLIQKGLDRQVVYYWYQSRDRVVARGTGPRSTPLSTQSATTGRTLRWCA